MTAHPIDLPLKGSSGTLRIVPWEGTEIREGRRYLYRLMDTDRRLLQIEPSELFVSHPDDPNTGDFRPSNHVGDILLTLALDDGTKASVSVEVLPTKLEYETEYRAMLQQIADHAAEAVLQGFAPAAVQAHVDPAAEARTHYRSLAFLIARLRDDSFQAAIERIRHRPHHGWVENEECRRIGSGLRMTPSTARSLLRAKASVPTPAHLSHLPLEALPSTVQERRTEATHDTLPNRFVRYAFSRWQGLALQTLEKLADARSAGAGPRARGLREAQWLVDRCEEVLAVPAIRDAGTLTGLPTANEALRRRPGYREVFRTFALAEASMALEAMLPDDPFSATQRNVATLYEYWCFVALADVLTTIAGRSGHGLLFEPTENGLSLALRQGEASRLSWELDIDGRVLVGDLWFNSTFRRTEDHQDEMVPGPGSLSPTLLSGFAPSQDVPVTRSIQSWTCGFISTPSTESSG